MLRAAASIFAAAACFAAEPPELVIPGDPGAFNAGLAGLAEVPPRAPDPALVAGPWASADDRDPALRRHWTSAFARFPAEALDAAYREAAVRTADPWARCAVAFRYLPAPAAARDLAPFADAAFDRGDFRGFLALARSGDPRSAIARALDGGGGQVDPSLELRSPGVPEAVPRPAVRDPGAGIAVTWSIGPDRLQALDPWGRPLWQRTFAGQAEIRTGPGGAVAGDQAGVHLVREDGTLVAARLQSLGDQRIAVAGSAAWFMRGAAILRVAFADGRESGVQLPEAPLAPPLVRGGGSLWLTRHELVLLVDGAVHARMRHGLAPDGAWSLGAQRERIFILAPGGAYRVPALTDQLASASPARCAELLSRAGRQAEVLALAMHDERVLADPAGRRAALLAHLASGSGRWEDLLRLAATPEDRARALSAALLPGSVRDPRLEALIAGEPALRFPADAARFADEADSWDQVLSGRALLGIPADRPLYAVADEGDATVASCSEGPEGAFRWRNRWAAEPVPSGAPRRSIVRRGAFLVVSEGIGRLVVLEPERGDVLGAIDVARFDAEPAATTVLGRGADGVLRLALMHPPGVEDRITILGDDGSVATTLLGSRALSVVRTSDRQVRAELEDGVIRLIDVP